MELFVQVMLGLYVMKAVIRLIHLSFGPETYLPEITKFLVLFDFLWCCGMAAWAAYVLLIN